MRKIWIKISEVLFFQEGPGVRNTQYTTEGVKLLNVANLVNGKVDLSTSDRYISKEEAYGKYKHFLCDVGDFIVASSGIKVEYIDKKMDMIDAHIDNEGCNVYFALDNALTTMRSNETWIPRDYILPLKKTDYEGYQ